MLHNDVAQQRAGEQPASAPKTSQKSPRAQTPAKFKTLTLKQADSRHEDIDVAGLRDGSKDTTRMIHIHGRHSPLTSGQLTTHTTRQMLQHPKGLTTSHSLSPCPYHSLHDTIPSGKDTCRPARSSDLSLVRSNNSRPDWRPRPNYSTHKARQKFYTTSPCPYHSLHDTIPSGWCRPARSSDLSMVRSNNSYNHQRCRRRRGQARAIQTRPNGQRETRSS